MEITPAKLSSMLAEKKIGTCPFFWPIHEQPVCLQKMQMFPDQSYPNAEKLARQNLYLSSGLGLSNTAIMQVCETLVETFDEH